MIKIWYDKNMNDLYIKKEYLYNWNIIEYKQHKDNQVFTHVKKLWDIKLIKIREELDLIEFIIDIRLKLIYLGTNKEDSYQDKFPITILLENNVWKYKNLNKEYWKKELSVEKIYLNLFIFGGYDITKHLRYLFSTKVKGVMHQSKHKNYIDLNKTKTVGDKYKYFWYFAKCRSTKKEIKQKHMDWLIYKGMSKEKAYKKVFIDNICVWTHYDPFKQKNKTFDK